MKKLLLLLLLITAISGNSFSQIVPFTKRYETTQRGGLVMVANSIVTCNGGAACSTGQAQTPPSGTYVDNTQAAAYIDIDGDTTTFSSSSADMNLPSCSKVTFAGIYWGAAINLANANYPQRNSLQILQPGASSYSTITADTIYDFFDGYNGYNCFKDITSLVKASGNGTFTIANLVAETGVVNKWGGWGIVVAYKNDLMQERNISVFDGVASVNGAGSEVTVNVSGFFTPPGGAVNFQLGEMAYDGDRNYTGDSLLFQSAGGFVPVSDALHPVNDVFNSSICNNASQVLTRNPAFTNTLGYDANIFVPDNSAKNYLGNSANSAQIKVTTGGEQIWLQVITSVIDTYEPHIQMMKTVNDVNGGTVNTGDTLLYTISVQNTGYDTSTATTITDTLPFNADYIPNTVLVTSGPNTGAKTDVGGDDQAELIVSPQYNILKVNLGNGATAGTGGEVPHTGANSTTSFTFKMKITDDCTKLSCNPTIANRSYVDFTGQISGIPRQGSSNPLLFDSLGCPIEGFTTTTVDVPVFCTTPPDSSIEGCFPLRFDSVPGIRTNYDFFDGSFASVTYANAPGTYYAIRSIPGVSCKDTMIYTLTQAVPTTANAGIDQVFCNTTSTTLSANSAVVGTGKWSVVSGPNTPVFGNINSPTSTITGLIPGTYTLKWTISLKCDSSEDTMDITNYPVPTTSNAGANQNLCNVITATFAGNTPTNGSGTWTQISGPNTAGITTPSSSTSGITGLITGTYIFRWTISSGTCTASFSDVQIRVYALPTTSSAGSDQNLCNVTTTTMAGNTPTVGTGSWSQISGPNTASITTASSASTGITGMITGVYVFRWTITNGVCASSTDDVTITNYALPTTANANADQNLCNVTTTTMAGNSPSVGTGAWSQISGPNTASITTASSSTTGITGMTTGVYVFRWTITNGVCASSTDDVTITNYALPTTANANADQNLCNVTTTTMAGNTPTVGTGAWSQISGPNTASITTATSPSTGITGMITGVYVFRWSITNGVCASSTDDVTITNYALPTTANANADQNLCNVTTTTMAGNTPTVGTGSWSQISGPNTASITTASSATTGITGMTTGVYVFRWTITNGVCASSTDDVTITNYALPTTANANADQNLCNVTTTTMAGNTPTVGTGSWSQISGPNTASITTASSATTGITGMITGVYVFRWTITNGVCATSTDDITINNYALPTTANANADQNLCSVTSSAFSGNTPTTGTGAWSQISGPNTAAITTPASASSTLTGMIPGVYVFRWTITSGPCATSTDDVQITIYASGTAANANSDQNLCNVSTTTLAGNTPSIGSGAWSQISGPNTAGITTISSPSSGITGMIPGTYVFRWTITSGVCAPSTDDVQITVYDLPTTANANADQFLCNATSATMAGNTPTVGTGAWSQISGPNTATITTAANPSTGITGMISGTYVFRWTITNGVCASSTDNVTITNYALPTIANANSDQNLCDVTSATLAANTPSVGTGSWSQISGPNTAGITTASNPSTGITAMIPGVYVFRWTITNGVCATSTDDVTLNNFATPTVSSAGSDQNLCNSNSITLNGNTPVDGTGNWTFASGPNTPSITDTTDASSPVTGMIPGNYSFIWTISSGVCAVSEDTVDIIINSLSSTSDAGADQPLCNVNSSVLSGNIPVSGSGTWTFISGPNTASITDTTNAASSVTGLIPGNYLFTWTIISGVCSATSDTVELINYELPTASNAGNDQALCNDTTITLAGNNPVYGAGTWSLISGPNVPVITAPNDSNSVVTGVIPGTYLFNWSILNGVCSTSDDTVQIIIYQYPPVIDGGPDQELCNPNSVVLTGNVPAQGTGTWEFVDGPYTAAITAPNDPVTTATGIIPGVYIFKWTISNGVCTSSSDSVEYVIDDVPTVSDANTDQYLCNATSIHLTGNNSAVGSGDWALLSGPNTPSIANSSNPSTPVTGIIPGTYQFTWTISNGVCASSEDTVSYTIYSIPLTADAGTDQVLCNAGGTILSGATPSSGNGTWTFISGPTAAVIDTPSNITTSVSGFSTGTYLFGWTVNNGVCSTPTDSVSVSIDALPTVSTAGTDQIVCNDTSAMLVANNPATGSGTWSFLSGPTSASIMHPSDSSTTTNNLSEGVYVFRWTIANGVCSSSTDDVQITVHELPLITNAGSDQYLCNETNLFMAADSAVSGHGTWSFISGPNTPVINISDNPSTSVSGTIPGTYLFGWTLSNETCVMQTDTVSITNYNLSSQADAGTDQQICNAVSATLNASTPAYGNGTWTAVSGPTAPMILYPSLRSTTVSNLTPGTYIFRWTVTNGICDSTTDDVQILIDNLPASAIAGTDQIVCGDSVTTLQGTQPVTGSGSWSVVSSPSSVYITCDTCASSALSGLATGVTTMRWTVSNGVCNTVTDDVEINTVSNPTSPFAGNDQTVCSNDTIHLAGNSLLLGTGAWSVVSAPASTTITQQDASHSFVPDVVTGPYTFRWTVSAGSCTLTDDVNVNIIPAPVVATSADQVHICPLDQITLVATGANSFVWSPSSHLDNTTIYNPVASPMHSTMYVVTGTNPDGCFSSDSVFVEVCDTIIIPNGFSPDGDGVNDYFTIIGIDNYPGNAIHIYNRWGNLIYEKTGYDNSWDGTPNVGGLIIGNGKVPAATYFYVFEAGDGTKSRSGYIVIKY